MQKVDKHISELLFEHDCVIVPEFGGFVANYASAKIHPVQHSFTPPSKNIVFNKNLNNNDGLLANHIASTEKTTYPEALQYIHHFVSTTNEQLKKGAKVKIEEVGTLHLDVERNIQFEPSTTNYLLEAFGLSQFQSPAIKRDNIGKRIEKEFTDRGAIPLEKKKINVKRYATLAVALPLIFAMVWIPLKTDLLKNINYSNINPFASKEIAKYKAKDKSSVKELTAEDFSATPLINENDTSKYISLYLTEKSAQPITANMVDNTTVVDAVKPDTTKVVNNVLSNLDFKFHIVTGCFQIESNAKNFVADLQSKNINATIIGQNNNGLYVVSCGDYATRREAINELAQIKKAQPNAWLYKN